MNVPGQGTITLGPLSQITIGKNDIYQLHIGTATSEGTFEALIDQLPRLKELGVNAIEPLPIAEFPGSIVRVTARLMLITFAIPR